MTTRKEQAQNDFKELEVRIDNNLQTLIETEDYSKILNLNDENNQMFHKYNKIIDNQEIGYDMTTFQQDTKNTTKILGALHKMTLKSYESKAFKFNWKIVANGMKKLSMLNENELIDGAGENDENADPSVSRHDKNTPVLTSNEYDRLPMAKLTRKDWIKAANRLFAYPDLCFPATGFSSTFYSCHNALASCDNPKVKKEKKTGLSAVEKQKHDRAKKQAEAKLAEAADEQADVADDYDQKDGQVSTKVIQKVLLTIEEEMNKKNSSKLEYIPAVIDPDSFARTIENMFHISFLIKDNKLGIELDRNNIPYLVHLSRPNMAVSHPSTGASSSKRVCTTEDYGKPAQGVIMMTMDLWEAFIEKLDLKSNRQCLFSD